jgi:general secretion pathway protein F
VNSIPVELKVNDKRHNQFWEVVGMTSTGEEFKKYLFLPNVGQVRKEIEQSGSYIISIKEHTHSIWQKEWFSRDYKINFLKAMFFHVDVGSSPGRALMLVIEAEKNPRKRIELEPALQVLKRGGTFTDSIDVLGLFDRPIIAILQAGEFSGLNVAISDAITMLQTRKGVIKTLLQAVGILGIDLFVSFSSCVGVHYQVLPMMEKQIPTDASPEKIAHYKDIIESAYFYNGILMWISFVIILLFAVAGIFSASGQKGRDFVSDLLAKMPIFKRMIYDALLADSFMLMGRMLSSGVSLMNCVKILESVAPLKSLVHFWNRIHASLGNGESVSKAFNDRNILVASEKMILESHQDKNQLAKIMLSLSEQRLSMSESGTKAFMKLVSAFALFYVLATVGIALMVLKIQDFGISSSFESMTK